MTDRLALVPGEPAGVGPELCVKLAQQPPECGLLAFADPDCLARAAERLGLPLTLVDANGACGPGLLPVQAIPQARIETPGQPDPDNAGAVIGALLAGAHACRSGRTRALVTGPVHKASINAGGIAYTGTTELLAEDAGASVVMMLANPQMRVALVTTHLPLREVADAVTPQRLEQTLRITLRALETDFGLRSPRLAVLGLNPHAGEDGVLGREEIDVIIPVLDRLRAEGHDLVGPLPADTAFLPRKLAGFDTVLAMYHDQGLPVLKHSGFENAVNITLGLPYPRVAVDHGTALDLAGRGMADPSSLQAAVELATRLADARSGHRLDPHGTPLDVA